MFEGGQTPIKIISLLFQFQSLRRALCSTPPARSLVEAMAAAALKDKLNAHVADMVATVSHSTSGCSYFDVEFLWRLNRFWCVALGV
jgi:hypothetical protein